MLKAVRSCVMLDKGSAKDGSLSCTPPEVGRSREDSLGAASASRVKEGSCCAVRIGVGSAEEIGLSLTAAAKGEGARRGLLSCDTTAAGRAKEGSR